MSLEHGLYFYVVGVILALLEIEVEGKNGWAAQLPTWRWDSPWVMKWIGKPITGYHVSLNLLLLLLIHGPLVEGGFTWALEAKLLSFYFLISVFWDFHWFIANPHFGLRRFNKDNVWWFKGWQWGLPHAYFAGLIVSLALYALIPGAAGREQRALEWAKVLGLFTGLTLVAIGIVRLRRATSKTPDGAGSAH